MNPGPYIITRPKGSGGGGVQIATGTYTGDGTLGRIIVTGLSGTIRNLMLFRFSIYRDPGIGLVDTYAKTSSHPTDIFVAIPGQDQGGAGDGGITFSIANFIVDDNISAGGTFRNPNRDGDYYTWVAYSSP